MSGHDPRREVSGGGIGIIRISILNTRYSGKQPALSQATTALEILGLWQTCSKVLSCQLSSNEEKRTDYHSYSRLVRGRCRLYPKKSTWYQLQINALLGQKHSKTVLQQTLWIGTSGRIHKHCVKLAYAVNITYK